MVSRIGIHDKFVAATVGTELTDENADKFLIDTAAVKFRLPLINGERVLVYKTYQDNDYGHNAVEIYSDGYCEQRYCYWANDTVGVLTFLHPFADTQYNVSIAQEGRGSDDTGGFDFCSSVTSDGGKTPTSIKLSMESKSCHLYVTLSGKTNRCAVTDYNCGNYLFFKLADEVPSTVVNTEQVVNDLKHECDDFKAALEEKFNQGIFVTESWTDGNGEWYRKYSDGWIEQGGFLNDNGQGTITTHSLHCAFSNNKYTLIISKRDTRYGNNGQSWEGVNSTTNTSFEYELNYTTLAYWYACGY